MFGQYFVSGICYGAVVFLKRRVLLDSFDRSSLISFQVQAEWEPEITVMILMHFS